MTTTLKTESSYAGIEHPPLVWSRCNQTRICWTRASGDLRARPACVVVVLARLALLHNVGAYLRRHRCVVMARPYHRKPAAYQWLHSAGRHSQGCHFSNTCQSNIRHQCRELVLTSPHSSACSSDSSALPLSNMMSVEPKRSRRRKKCRRRSDDCCKPSKCQTPCRSKCDRYKWALENNRKERIWSFEEVAERPTKARRRRRSSSGSCSRSRLCSRRCKRSTQRNLPHSSCKTIPLRINSDTNLYVSIENSYAKCRKSSGREKSRVSPCGSPETGRVIPSYYDLSREETRRNDRNVSVNHRCGSANTRRRNAISGRGFRQSCQQQPLSTTSPNDFFGECTMIDPLSSQPSLVRSRSTPRQMSSRGPSTHSRRGDDGLRGAPSTYSLCGDDCLREAPSTYSRRSDDYLRGAPSTHSRRGSNGLRGAPSTHSRRGSDGLRGEPSTHSRRGGDGLRGAPSAGSLSTRNPPPVIYSLHPQQERSRSSKPLPVASPPLQTRAPTSWGAMSRSSSNDWLEDEGGIFDLPDILPPRR